MSFATLKADAQQAKQMKSFPRRPSSLRGMTASPARVKGPKGPPWCLRSQCNPAPMTPQVTGLLHEIHRQWPISSSVPPAPSGKRPMMTERADYDDVSMSAIAAPQPPRSPKRSMNSSPRNPSPPKLKRTEQHSWNRGHASRAPWASTGGVPPSPQLRPRPDPLPWNFKGNYDDLNGNFSLGEPASSTINIRNDDNDKKKPTYALDDYIF